MSDDGPRDESAMLADAPRRLFGTAHEMYSVPYAEIQALQLAALERRFEELHDRIPMLRRLAQRSNVTAIGSLADGGRLLYPSAVYKSYKGEWLESGEFDRLTQWMQQLTAVDLAPVDTARCRSLDGWFDAIEAASPVVVCHSSATTGKLSFVPRSEVEWRKRATTMAYGSESAGIEDGPRQVSFEGLPIVSPFYRTGHSAFLMSMDWNVRVHGDPDQVETLYPGHLSSDLLVIAAQLRLSAGGTGLAIDPGSVAELPSWLVERWEELRALATAPPADAIEGFARRSAARFGGQPVWVIGVWPSLVDVGGAAANLGLSHVFAAESIVHTGGGAKGRSDLPSDAERQVLDWLGVPQIRETYGMSELAGMNVRCCADHYHLNPWTIPYVLDHDGSVLPSEGSHRGRFGGIDLLAETYWGGYLSTDEVTLTWDGCPCGRHGPFLDLDISRTRDIVDDKVSCAATPALHDDAIAVLTGLGSTR